MAEPWTLKQIAPKKPENPKNPKPETLKTLSPKP